MQATCLVWSVVLYPTLSNLLMSSAPRMLHTKVLATSISIFRHVHVFYDLGNYVSRQPRLSFTQITEYSVPLVMRYGRRLRLSSPSTTH
jgi:hypothetical protein